jgi:D-alanyl-D-alanine carboxypeptidase
VDDLNDEDRCGRPYFRRMSRVGMSIAVLTLIGVSAGTFGFPADATSATPSPPAVLDTFPPGTQARLNGLVTEARSLYHIPGVIVSVSVPGEGIWEGAYGEADLQSSQRLSLADHFPIGSVTKTFTATVILRLVQEGLLTLSAPISRWVPQVQDARQITVRMLLHMTSGIYDEFGSGSQLIDETTAHPHRTITPEEVVRLAVAHGPVGPPGTPEYSSTNYIILGIIARDITHQTIGSLITSQILQPLHLDQTNYSTSSALPSPSALDYIVSSGSPKAIRLYDLSNLGAAGGMVSTVHDMAVWAQALGSGELLTPTFEAKRLQFGPVLGSFYPLPTQEGVAPSLPVRYGLGLFSLGGLIGHNGEVNGYVDDVVYSPSRHATIVVFANASPSAIPGGAADALTVSIADIALQHR